MFTSLFVSLVIQIIGVSFLIGGADRWATIMIASGAILFYGFYVIIDLHMISERLALDDYIIGALTLYIDLMVMFIYILEIIGKKK
jgi:FtsH-binding integral membrane protein